MYRSEASEKGREFVLIDKPEHIAKVENLIEKNFDSYFHQLLENARNSDSIERLRARWGRNTQAKSDAEIIKALFSQQIDEYEKEAESYREIFNLEIFEEYHQVENEFKAILTRQCPVIRYSFNSRAEELTDWRKLFAITSSVDLLDIFDNLINFATCYAESYDEEEYQKYSEPHEFGFDEIEEEDYKIVGVVGMGIKAVTLYHLYPSIFPRRGKMDLFGMYFLTEKSSLKLPTKTSEFIMVNDQANGEEGIYKIDQNYWYPYNLFTAYAMKIYRMIAARCQKIGVLLDPGYRYVYVNTYLENIYFCHTADIQTLTQSSSLHRKNTW